MYAVKEQIIRDPQTLAMVLHEGSVLRELRHGSSAVIKLRGLYFVLTTPAAPAALAERDSSCPPLCKPDAPSPAPELGRSYLVTR